MPATFSRKKDKSGYLAKPESCPTRLRRISMSFSTWASCRRRKNSSAVFPVNPIVQRRIAMGLEILDSFGRRTECKLLRLAAERILKSHVAFIDEERAAVERREIVQFEEAILSFALRFEFAAAADMQRRDAAIEQRRANHEEA